MKFALSSIKVFQIVSNFNANFRRANVWSNIQLFKEMKDPAEQTKDSVYAGAWDLVNCAALSEAPFERFNDQKSCSSATD